MNRPPYVPPEGLKTTDVEVNMDALQGAERERRATLNHNLRNILDTLRKNFATPANAFAVTLSSLKSALASASGNLNQQFTLCQSKQSELEAIADQLPLIQSAELHQLAANIEDNEYTDHTYDDLAFEYEQLKKNYAKKISFVETQIQAEAASKSISPEQLQEFKETFNHFDTAKAGQLSKLDFKSCLSGLGVVELDFEGGNAVFESIFTRVSEGQGFITFSQFVDYMVSITADTVSHQQLADSFATLAGGKDYVTVQDFKVGQLTEGQIEYLTSQLPPKSGVAGGYDYKTWLAKQF
jgi:Ca2+-binding EF-hand superfamily protein